MRTTRTTTGTGAAAETALHRRTEARPQRRSPMRARARFDPHVTLLELVAAVSSVTDDDEEVVATVAHMLRSGAVTLQGTFRGERILRHAKRT